MVLPAKVFEMRGEFVPELAVQKLSDFREEEHHEAEKREEVLVSEILDLKLEEDLLAGVFSKDFARLRQYRRRPTEALVTEEAPFWMKRSRGRFFLIVLAPSVARGVKKLLTGNVARKLSEVLFLRPGAIEEATISHETLRQLHESNPGATRLIWFDNIDMPGIEKLCLAGPSLSDTETYRDYLRHGNIWYVVFEVKGRGLVVGITRNCVVTLFSRSTISDFTGYIFRDILDLVE